MKRGRDNGGYSIITFALMVEDEWGPSKCKQTGIRHQQTEVRVITMQTVSIKFFSIFKLIFFQLSI